VPYGGPGPAQTVTGGAFTGRDAPAAGLWPGGGLAWWAGSVAISGGVFTGGAGYGSLVTPLQLGSGPPAPGGPGGGAGASINAASCAISGGTFRGGAGLGGTLPGIGLILAIPASATGGDVTATISGGSFESDPSGVGFSLLVLSGVPTAGAPNGGKLVISGGTFTGDVLLWHNGAAAPGSTPGDLYGNALPSAVEFTGTGLSWTPGSYPSGDARYDYVGSFRGALFGRLAGTLSDGSPVNVSIGMQPGTGATITATPTAVTFTAPGS
jgi:hypothetical protein